MNGAAAQFPAARKFFNTRNSVSPAMAMPFNPSPIPPSRSPSAATPALQGSGWIVLISVLFSIIASGATCAVILRYSLINPTAPVAAAAAKKPTAVTGNATAKPVAASPIPVAPPDPLAAPALPPLPTQQAPDNSPADLAHPMVVATNAGPIIQGIEQDTDFVGPSGAGKHTALYSDLSAVQVTALAVANDDGADPAKSANLDKMLARALDGAIKRSDQIANRPNESDDVRAKSAQVSAILQQLRGQ